jgi:hypothetical protein
MEKKNSTKKGRKAINLSPRIFMVENCVWFLTTTFATIVENGQCCDYYFRRILPIFLQNNLRQNCNFYFIFFLAKTFLKIVTFLPFFLKTNFKIFFLPQIDVIWCIIAFFNLFWVRKYFYNRKPINPTIASYNAIVAKLYTATKM